jgi:L-iditol 2-dehydrogenase
MLELPENVTFEAAAMTEPLACVVRGLDETDAKIGDIVAVIGGGPIGLSFMQVARIAGCHVIAVVKHDQQVEAAKHFGAQQVVQITATDDPIGAVRALTPDGRGADIVIEAVARPQAWEWAVDMVRRGGVVNFFGGPPKGTQVSFDTNRLHYSDLTLKASFHHTPAAVRKAFRLICEGKVRSADYVTGQASLSNLSDVLKRMLDRGSIIKTAIIPGK